VSWKEVGVGGTLEERGKGSGLRYLGQGNRMEVMSTDACIVYFGLRYEMREDEIEGVERRLDPRIVAARKVGLKHYWGNFGGVDEKYLLFIGSELGVLGPENANAINLSKNELKALFDNTGVKLNEAGFAGVPSLYLEWQPR
jgi:hypothetical protein